MDRYEFERLLNSTISNKDDFLLCVEGDVIIGVSTRRR